MLGLLYKGKVEFPPLSLRYREYRSKTVGEGAIDAMVEASWGKKSARFVIECRALSTPKSFQESLGLLEKILLPAHFNPMLLMPYLSDDKLLELEARGISGIDLCGNGVVMASGVFALFRSGRKTRFTSSASIKNIYRKNSSMVGRAFLSLPGYGSVQEICLEINARNMLVQYAIARPMSLPTVSKSLKTLEDDLIVQRNGEIRLIQSDKLLEKLSDNYSAPKITERVRLKLTAGNAAIGDLIGRIARKSGVPVMATGTSSVARYAVMQRGDLLSIYCPSIEPFLEQLPGKQADRFPDVEFIETMDESVYFDARQEGDFRWASPVQVYLELMAGDQRDRNTASQVKSHILGELHRLTE